MNTTPPGTDTSSMDFNWTFTGRVTVIDNGATLVRQDSFPELMATDAFSVIAFDPTSCLQDRIELQDIDELQIVPHALLGNGDMATLHVCVDPAMSGTLAPLEENSLPTDKRRGADVLTQLPITTLALDTLDDLPVVDWLILDEFNDPIETLDNGINTLAQILLVHVRIAVMPLRQHQPGLTQIISWMEDRGFQCYILQNGTHQSHLPFNMELEKKQASQMATVDAIFTPDEDRLAALDAIRLMKLAFLLDAIHGIHDYAYSLLARTDAAQASDYLIARGYKSIYYDEPDTFTLTADYSPAPW